jgi:amino acid adenylation domain-containing protein
VTTTDFLFRVIELARARPNHIAVKDLERSLTYGELIDEAAAVGAGLAVHGVARGDRVSLLLENSVDFVVASIATLWVGAVFVPLNVNDPVERIAMILADCEPSIVISVDPDGSGVGDARRTVSFAALRADTNEQPRPSDARPTAVYMIYTSGTTGTPKGVLVGSSAFSAALSATVDALNLGEGTRTLCVSPFYFDGSFATLFPTLFAGGTVVIRPRSTLLFPQTFFKAITSEDITYTGFSPTYLRLLLSSARVRELSASSLEIVALGGENSSAIDIRKLWSHAPDLKVYNRYGPTETTIAVTHILLTTEMVSDDVVPLGSPHPDVSFHLVDEEGRVRDETNQMGELYIGGVQLMEGYWGAADLTSEVLRRDVVPGELVYRTGDLVYRNSDGHYVYVERADRVVKRSGVRISLVEIASAVRGVEKVEDAVCLAFDLDGELGVVVFVVADESISVRQIRTQASERLPDNMLPDRVEFVKEFPLTASGKLDERQLLGDAGLRAIRR